MGTSRLHCVLNSSVCWGPSGMHSISVLVSPWVLVDMVRVGDWWLSRSAMASSWGVLFGTPWRGLFGILWKSHCLRHIYWHQGSNGFRNLALSVAGRHFQTWQPCGPFIGDF